MRPKGTKNHQSTSGVKPKKDLTVQETKQEILESVTCPLDPGPNCPLRMSRISYENHCLRTQLRRLQGAGAQHGTFSRQNSCNGCDRGTKIKGGRKFKAPDHVTFTPYAKFVREVNEG